MAHLGKHENTNIPPRYRKYSVLEANRSRDSPINDTTTNRTRYHPYSRNAEDTTRNRHQIQLGRGTHTDALRTLLVPSGWTPLTGRRSSRQFKARPWGPRHLESEYHSALETFKGSAYAALGLYGYKPSHIKGPIDYSTLPSMADLRKQPDFNKACDRLDEADRKLEEALANGQTWENTPVLSESGSCTLDDNTDLVDLGNDKVWLRSPSASTSANIGRDVESGGLYPSSSVSHSGRGLTTVSSADSSTTLAAPPESDDDKTEPNKDPLRASPTISAVLEGLNNNRSGMKTRSSHKLELESQMEDKLKENEMRVILGMKTRRANAKAVLTRPTAPLQGQSPSLDIASEVKTPAPALGQGADFQPRMQTRSATKRRLELEIEIEDGTEAMERNQTEQSNKKSRLNADSATSLSATILPVLQNSGASPHKRVGSTNTTTSPRPRAKTSATRLARSGVNTTRPALTMAIRSSGRARRPNVRYTY